MVRKEAGDRVRKEEGRIGGQVFPERPSLLVSSTINFRTGRKMDPSRITRVFASLVYILSLPPSLLLVSS